MLEVNQASITLHSETLKELLGESFIQELESVDTNGLPWSQVIQVNESAHPMALWWKNFNSEISAMNETGELRISETTIRLIDMLDDLITIQKASNNKRIIESLKKRGTFYSSIHEASVAADYINMGYSVDVVEESTNGARTSDLRITTPNGHVVPVECKSLDDIDLKQSKHWTELQHRLVNAFMQHKRSWFVKIFSNMQVSGKEVEVIYSNVLTDLKAGRTERRTFGDEMFAVEYEVLADWDREFVGAFQFPMPTSIGTAAAEIMWTERGQQIWKNPHAVGVFPYLEGDVSKRLIHEFKKAKGQIPKNGPGLIHIAIPFKHGSRLLQVVDSSYMALFRKINNDTRRVNAVVISASVIENNQQTPFVSHHFIVPNLNSKTSLNEDFKIAGAVDANIEIPEQKGSIEFRFTISDWHQGKSAILFQQYSKHGNRQVRVWKTWDNRLRFDLFNPSYSRIFIDSDVIELDVNANHCAVGTWDSEKICLYLDGHLVGVRCHQGRR